MARQFVLMLGMLMLLGAGCSQSRDDLRTYTEGEDGDASTVELADSAANGQSQAVQQAVEVGQLAPQGEPTTPVSGTTASVGTQQESTGASETAAADAPESVRPPRVPAPIRIDSAIGGVGTASLTSVEASSEPREIKLLVAEKDFPRIDAGKTLRVTYDDLDLLKILNMDPVPSDCAEHFPSWLQELDGMQVRIRGFMYPPDRSTGLPGFVLRDNQICCFGRNPKVYDIIPVFLKPGTTTDYIPNRPFDVVGRLLIRPDSYRGKIQNLYEIEEAEVITR